VRRASPTPSKQLTRREVSIRPESGLSSKEIAEVFFAREAPSTGTPTLSTAARRQAREGAMSCAIALGSL